MWNDLWACIMSLMDSVQELGVEPRPLDWDANMEQGCGGSGQVAVGSEEAIGKETC